MTTKAWRDIHKVEVAAYQKAYYRAYYQAHKEELLEKERARASSPEARARKAAARRAYRQEHWEEIRASEKARSKVRRTSISTGDQACYQAYKEEICKKLNARRHRRKVEVMTHYGGRCACCGEDQVDALCIDHINGDGAAHRKEIGSGKLYAWLKKNEYPAGFQVLCWNCNAVKSIRGKCTLVHDFPMLTFKD